MSFLHKLKLLNNKNLLSVVCVNLDFATSPIISNMPKHKSSSSAKNSGTKGQMKPEKVPLPMPDDGNPIKEIKPGEFLIPLAVKPGSKTDAITDISSDAISIHISAPPVDGEANLAIVKYFVSLLHVKKTEIELRGGKSRSKSLVLNSPSLTSASQILDLLEKAKSES